MSVLHYVCISLAMTDKFGIADLMNMVAGAVVKIAIEDRWTTFAALAATIELALPALAHLYQIANTCDGLTFACVT